jgi:diguanylate cyclase (GGDEF)-like protein
MNSMPLSADLDQPTPAHRPAQSLAPVWSAGAAPLLEAVLAQHHDMLLVKDSRSGQVLHANPAMAAWLQKPAAELIGCTDADLFEPALATALRAAEHTALAQPGSLVSEHRVERAHQRQDFQVLRLQVPAEPEVFGGAPLLCAVWTDLAEQRQREQQLQAALQQIEQLQRANDVLRRDLADQALRDQASGLYTRAHFEDQLRREVDLSTREHREFAIVFIEIDPSGPAVKNMGEPGQRRVLEAMGRLLRSGTRAMDASCRYSEGRFAVLLSGVGLATAHARMEGLRRQCATQIVVHEGQELRFSVAMGVASFPHTAHTQDELVSACNAALAEAQRRGGNHVTLASIRFEADTGGARSL